MPVYEPREDSFFMAEFLKEKGKVGGVGVDVGTGSGILAEILAEKCELVVACDISREALKKARERVKRKNVFFVRGNLVEFMKRCDVVVFNAPYLSKEDGEEYDATIHHQLPDGRDLLEEFVKSLSRLEFRRAYLLFSTHSSIQRMTDATRMSKLKIRVVARKRVFFEELMIGEITK